MEFENEVSWSDIVFWKLLNETSIKTGKKQLQDVYFSALYVGLFISNITVGILPCVAWYDTLRMVHKLRFRKQKLFTVVERKDTEMVKSG